MGESDRMARARAAAQRTGQAATRAGALATGVGAEAVRGATAELVDVARDVGVLGQVVRADGVDGLKSVVSAGGKALARPGGARKVITAQFAPAATDLRDGRWSRAAGRAVVHGGLFLLPGDKVIRAGVAAVRHTSASVKDA